MDAFAKMDKLTHLYLVKLKINDLTPVSQLPELKTICPVGTDIADIECPGKLDMPESVEIYGYGNKYVINQATQNLSNLQRLIVTDDIPDDRGLPVLNVVIHLCSDILKNYVGDTDEEKMYFILRCCFRNGTDFSYASFGAS